MFADYSNEKPGFITFYSNLNVERKIVLCNKDGKQAVIDFGGDEVTFTGDLPVDEAAQMFFKFVKAQLGFPTAED